MAGKNSIQVLRGTAAKRTASSETLLAGQPFFETDTGKFYVGTGGAIKSATPVVATPTAHSHTVANITDLTATATELNYCDGVTSSIQTQLNAKAPTSHASSASTYGLGTTSNYGHVKISNGDVATVASSNGLAAGMDHTHSNYALSGHTHPGIGTWTFYGQKSTYYGIDLQEIWDAGYREIELRPNSVGTQPAFYYDLNEVKSGSSQQIVCDYISMYSYGTSSSSNSYFRYQRFWQQYSFGGQSGSQAIMKGVHGINFTKGSEPDYNYTGNFTINIYVR